MADLILWRRHVPGCPQAPKGRKGLKCKCPIWCDGYLNGNRIRQSMGTRDMPRAEYRLARMLEPESIQQLANKKPIEDAITAYLRDCETRNLQPSTLTSYRTTLGAFEQYCVAAKCFDVAQINVDILTAFRSDRPGKTQKRHIPDCPALLKRAGRRKCNCPIVTEKPTPNTLRKELETLRAFSAFCVAHEWMKTNHARRMKHPEEDEANTLPFTQSEIDAILGACDQIDNVERSRLRALALVQLLLYSGFRISDAAKFQRHHLDRQTGRFLIRMKKTREPLPACESRTAWFCVHSDK